MTSASETRISGLEALLRDAAARGAAPVERWNPPYCGDIGLAIRADGVWEYRGSPILRPEIVKLFARVLRRDADGRHYLVTPSEKVDVRVDDAPFLAVEMEVEGLGRQQTLVFRTNVDDVVRSGPGHGLRFAEERPGGGLKPYLLVRGRLEARLTRAIYYDLVELIETDIAGAAPAVWSGGERFPLLSSEAAG